MRTIASTYTTVSTVAAKDLQWGDQVTVYAAQAGGYANKHCIAKVQDVKVNGWGQAVITLVTVEVADRETGELFPEIVTVEALENADQQISIVRHNHV